MRFITGRSRSNSVGLAACLHRVALLVVVCAAQLSAADLTGTWMGMIPRRDRTPSKDVAVQLVQEGATLTGKVYSDAGPSAPLEGRVSGDEVRFTAEAREQAGNQINIVLYRFEGEIVDGRIEVTRERASARNAVSGADVPVRRKTDTDEQDRNRRFHSFRLERLF